MKRHHQQGIVLLVALVMMAVIGISSSIALRGALSQDIVSANQRARSLAAQASEAALRYCEASLTASNLTAAQAAIKRAPALAPEETPMWAKAETWTASSVYVNQIPKEFKFDSDSKGAQARPAECLIQEVTLSPMPSLDPNSPTPEAYIVTARGFSPDYAESGNNTPIAGAVVWLQSSVQIIR